MRILSIELSHFGKFTAFSQELSAGFTVIYGNNEAGKTTLMDFLQLMFYGSSVGGKDPRENIRKRYLDGAMETPSGVLRFETPEGVFRLSRHFGKSNSKDKIQLVKDGSGEEIALGSKETPGERFFHLNEDAFRRSVYVGASGTVIPAIKAKNGDQLMARLLNLRSTGDESTSEKEVLDRLVKAERYFIKGNGQGGALRDREASIARLQAEKAEALRKEEEKKMRQHALDSAKESFMRMRTAYEKQVEALKAAEEQWDARDLWRARDLRAREEALRSEVQPLQQLPAETIAKKQALESQEAVLKQEKERWDAAHETLERERITLEQEETHAEEQRQFLDLQLKHLEEEAREQEEKPKVRATLVWVGLALLVCGLLCALLLPLFWSTGWVFGLCLTVIGGLALGWGWRKHRHEENVMAEQRRGSEARRTQQRDELMRRKEEASAEQFQARAERLKRKLEQESDVLRQWKEDEAAWQKAQQALQEEESHRQTRREQLEGSLKQIEAQWQSDFARWKDDSLEALEEQCREAGLDGVASESAMKAHLDDLREQELHMRQEQEAKRLAIAEEEARLREQWKGVRLADAVDRDLKREAEQAERMRGVYRSLEIAAEAVQQATEKAHHNFGPQLNARTSEILQALRGRAGTVRVATDFAVAMESSEAGDLADWRLLSTGTIDQVYFALRMAVAELISGDENLPLFLDDAFAFYDDERAKHAFDFLQAYAAEKQKQILLFTAHHRFADWAYALHTPILALSAEGSGLAKTVEENGEENGR